MQPSVEYLGHRISSDGLHPTPDKIRTISEAPAPTNVPQLRAFLGMVNYYAKFLPQLSSVLAPLYRLLQKNARWSWGPEEQSLPDWLVCHSKVCSRTTILLRNCSSTAMHPHFVAHDG